MKKLLSVLPASAIIFLVLPVIAIARIGVGVGTGKIIVEENLKPGIIYQLPPLTILNTGDEDSEYFASVAYHQDQEENEPDKSWFKFSPEKFDLSPGEAQTVEIKLDLPVKVKPGDYFAYLEGKPAKKSESGKTTIGVAAAAKLYFTVDPGNFFQGLYYKGVSLWKSCSPWGSIILTVIIITLVATFLKRQFNININVKKKKRSKKDAKSRSGSNKSESLKGEENNEE